MDVLFDNSGRILSLSAAPRLVDAADAAWLIDAFGTKAGGRGGRFVGLLAERDSG
jgi:hypothetical protein